MKSGMRLVGLMAVLVISLAVAGCGGSSSVTSDLNSGSGTGGGTGITSIFDSPSEMGVGDIMPVEFDGSTQVLVDFAGVDY